MALRVRTGDLEARFNVWLKAKITRRKVRTIKGVINFNSLLLQIKKLELRLTGVQVCYRGQV